MELSAQGKKKNALEDADLEKDMLEVACASDILDSFKCKKRKMRVRRKVM